MSDPTKELIFQNEVIAEMVAGGWKRGNTGKLSSGHKDQNSGYNGPDSGHNEVATQPIIRYEPNDMWMEFPFATDYLALVSARQTEKSTETPEKTSVETPVKTPVETPVKTPVKTPDRVLAILATQPQATLAEVAAQIKKSVRAVERASAKLVKAGRLRYVGPKKGGRWEVT